MPIIRSLKKELRDKFWERFRYTRTPFREWYQFKDGRWHPISMLSIKNYFATFAKGIDYTSLKEALYHPSFYRKLDAKQHLIGFENGVYDVKRQIFREGKSSDYVSKNTGYNYGKPDAKDIASVDKFLSDVFSDDEKARFLHYCLDCFRHSNGKKLWLFTGLTCSGKSTVMSLIEKAFGNYFGKAHLELPTYHPEGPKTQEAELHKELAHTYRCRLVDIWVDDYQMNQSILRKELAKLVAGEIRTRSLYSNYIKRLEYQVLTVCEPRPEPEKDLTEDIEYKKTQFNMQFLPNPISINHRLRDTKISDAIVEWKLAFMYMILNQ